MKLLDELEGVGIFTEAAWENLQELRWVLQDSTGMEVAATGKEDDRHRGRVIKDGVRKAIRDRQNTLN
jgi:hypothetical protein